MNINNILISKNSVFNVLLSVVLVLLLPLIAMQFTNEVDWDINDFVVAGVLLSFFGYLYEVLTKVTNKNMPNIVIALVVIGLLFFVWVSLI